MIILTGVVHINIFLMTLPSLFSKSPLVYIRMRTNNIPVTDSVYFGYIERHKISASEFNRPFRPTFLSNILAFTCSTNVRHLLTYTMHDRFNNLPLTARSKLMFYSLHPALNLYKSLIWQMSPFRQGANYHLYPDASSTITRVYYRR